MVGHMNDKLERIFEGSRPGLIEILSQNLPGGTEESQSG
jgi:hypothetical protein